MVDHQTNLIDDSVVGLQARPVVEGLLDKVLKIIVDVAAAAVGHRRQEVEDVVVAAENFFHLHHFGRNIGNEEEPVA